MFQTEDSESVPDLKREIAELRDRIFILEKENTELKQKFSEIDQKATPESQLDTVNAPGVEE